MKWGAWIQGRIQQLFSTEFLLTVAFMIGVYIVIMADKITIEVAGVLGTVMLPIMNYAWQRTKQKENGN